MRKFRIIKTATFGSGQLRLTKPQALSRIHNLREVDPDKGIYEIIRPVQFKSGEELSYDGNIPKTMADDLEALEENKAKDVIEQINAAATLAEVEALTRGETRKRVLKAAEERRAAIELELAAQSGGMTVSEVLAEISAFGLATELDIFMTELDMTGLTPQEKKLVTDTAEKRRFEISGGEN